MTAKQALEDWLDKEEIDFIGLAAKEYPDCPPEGIQEQADMLQAQLFQFTGAENTAEENIAAIEYGATYVGLNLAAINNPLPSMIVTKKMVAGWAASDSVELREDAARSDLVSAKDLTRLARDAVGSIAFTAQKNPKLSGAAILKLWGEHEIDRTAVLIREDVAELDQDLISELALEGLSYERIAAARNPAMSETILHKMSQDSYELVAEAAAANLAARHQPATV